MNQPTTKTWQQYEAGCAYKRRIGLYETVRRNERFLRGDQWQGSEGADLPKPVFNVIRRVIDYMICTIFSKRTSITYTDADLPYETGSERRRLRKQALTLLNKNAAFRWESCKMDKLMQQALYDAAISGDGVIYTYFDPDVHSAQLFHGDIVSETVDNVNLFVADVNRADIQKQEYVILSGRQNVAALRREAIRYGMSRADAVKYIQPDEDPSRQSGDLAQYELDGEDEAKATYLIKFWREDGIVHFEKSVKDAVLRRVNTGCHLYPIAYFNWYATKNSFHGTSPITQMIPNQKFINRGYAMVMKHMTDTAFSKVLYDKTKIPEWTNRVGEAIAAVGTENVSDAACIIGPGKLESGYLDLLDKATMLTKELTGATESALGSVDPTNTSAILAMQEASKVPLEQVRDNLCQCVEDIAGIWADMMCAYYPAERLVPYRENGEMHTDRADFRVLRETLPEAHVEVADPVRFSLVNQQALLDRLLADGHLTFAEYLRRLPAGVIADREDLIACREHDENEEKEETADVSSVQEKAA